jgi:geranylgeranyl reductase family protein
MDSCDILIVGAGPAGSSCAWKLRDSGLTTVILDKAIFPRDKVCGGWITPRVLQQLEIDSIEYARYRVLQPIRGFQIGLMDGPAIETDFGKPISYAVRRCEFDDYLLKRCGARFLGGTPLTSLTRSGESWIANGRLQARFIIGAGGHFCPVARYRGASSRNETCVAAQEAEFPMSENQSQQCSIRPEFPELYFCPDLKGYGWCVRKNNFLNVGLGRLDPHGLPEQLSAFLKFLRKSGKIVFDFPSQLRGHSYLLYGHSKREIARDGVLLVGDAAGLAYSQSGEGIWPAIESGLLAAQAIFATQGEASGTLCNTYRRLLTARFGKSHKEWISRVGAHVPTRIVTPLSRILLASRWFSRRVVERWFLHCNEPALKA